MKRRGFLNLFAAASVAVACRLQPESGFRLPEGVIPQEQLERLYRKLVAAASKAWNRRYQDEYILLCYGEALEVRKLEPEEVFKTTTTIVTNNERHADT